MIHNRVFMLENPMLTR